MMVEREAARAMFLCVYALFFSPLIWSLPSFPLEINRFWCRHYECERVSSAALTPYQVSQRARSQ